MPRCLQRGIWLIQCVVCCLLFTLAILPAQYKDPINMIISYLPKIRQRVEELPQYKGMIKQRKKAHVVKKIFDLIFFVIILSFVAYLSGCRSFNTTFIHVFIIFFVVNIYDLIVLDWGGSVIVRSWEYLAQKIWKKNIKIICSMREVLVLELF